MKKFWLLGLLIMALVALPLMAACGDGEETTTTAAPTETTAAPTETTAAPTETTAPAETTTTVGEPVTLLIGGTFALTGAYAEDTAAVLAGYEDYVKYVNDNKIIAPWHEDMTIPANLTFKLVWGDDALAPDKAVTIYEDLKSQGLLTERISGSPEGMALKDMLIADNIGATSQSTSPAYLQPVGNIFTNAPIYTDEMAAVAEWFLENWTQDRAPRVAYLTADSTLGRNIDIPEMQEFLVGLGYEFVGAQFVPMVPTAPPTTQLAWLKDNNVDLALGIMINPGSQPTIKEAVRLGMGVGMEYEITFAFGNPAHLQIFLPDMGATGNGVVVAGDFCAQDADVEGIAFANMLQDTYRANNKNGNVMYLDGIIEGMTQVQALRLASMEVNPAELTSEDVLKKGFWQIKNLGTGGITVSDLTYGEGDVQGVDSCRIQQVVDAKIVEMGSYPLRNILPAAQ